MAAAILASTMMQLGIPLAPMLVLVAVAVILVRR